MRRRTGDPRARAVPWGSAGRARTASEASTRGSVARSRRPRRRPPRRVRRPPRGEAGDVGSAGAVGDEERPGTHAYARSGAAPVQRAARVTHAVAAARRTVVDAAGNGPAAERAGAGAHGGVAGLRRRAKSDLGYMRGTWFAFKGGGAYGYRSFDHLPGAKAEERRVARSLLTVADRIEAVVLRITELTGACRRDSGRFRIRMSISSTDHVVVPENEGTEETVEVTFAGLGLPEGVVRKLAQNGVTTPSRSRPRPSRTPWPARTSSAVAAPAPARPSPSVCRPWPASPAAAPRSTSRAPSSSPRPVSSRCRSRMLSSPTATSSA